MVVTERKFSNDALVVCFYMILFTVPNSQIALNKQMSTVNISAEYALYAGREPSPDVGYITNFDTLVDRAKNSW
jgi:hypothetical protein